MYHAQRTEAGDEFKKKKKMECMRWKSKRSIVFEKLVVFCFFFGAGNGGGRTAAARFMVWSTQEVCDGD